MSYSTIPAKLTGTTLNFPVDFISRLGVGETISSASVTMSVYSGTDPSPQSMVSGSATISGSVVTQLFTGGVLGVIYEALYGVVTSLGQTPEIPAYLVVIPDLP